MELLFYAGQGKPRDQADRVSQNYVARGCKELPESDTRATAGALDYFFRPARGEGG
jgi:hypothetical protein